MAADFANAAWLDRAADWAKRLADRAGPHADLMLSVAERKLASWAEAVG